MTTFENTLCVGMHFRGGEASSIAANLTEESEVRLEREPENPYDAYAIKVMLGDFHLGYIERDKAAWISPLLDEGQSATVTLTGHVQRGKNLHPQFTIEVGV